MMATNSYNAEAIEVLSGLDPVKKRPGMYTDTSRPNHLAQEVIDNSVDEALAGHASRIEVNLYADGSLSVTDDGRGMPVDIHPEHKVSGVELILTRLHAGGKFSNKNYQFSGGLHVVRISVDNALPLHVNMWYLYPPEVAVLFPPVILNSTVPVPSPRFFQTLLFEVASVHT